MQEGDVRKINWPLGFSCGLNTTSSAWKDGEQPEGFAYIELCAGYHPYEDEEVRKQCLKMYREDMDRARRQGLKLWSVHLPYGQDLDLTAGDDRYDETFENFAWYVGETIAMGAKRYVVHVFVPEPVPLKGREDMLERANRNVKRLAEYVAEKGAILTVEALPRTNLGNTAQECLRMIAGTKAGICLDVNHLLTESHREFIAAAHDYIKTVHLSDYDFVDEKHWVPGEGKLDWKELLSLLSEYGYEGVLMFEVRYHKDGSRVSLKDIREGFCHAVGKEQK